MNYLIFDNHIYYDVEGKRGTTLKEKLSETFPSGLKDISIALIDSLQKKVSVSERNAFKKDEKGEPIPVSWDNLEKYVLPAHIRELTPHAEEVNGLTEAEKNALPG